jgi:hypothetical protein
MNATECEDLLDIALGATSEGDGGIENSHRQDV